jgi:hypothetical protein
MTADVTPAQRQTTSTAPPAAWMGMSARTGISSAIDSTHQRARLPPHVDDCGDQGQLGYQTRGAGRRMEEHAHAVLWVKVAQDLGAYNAAAVCLVLSDDDGNQHKTCSRGDH